MIQLLNKTAAMLLLPLLLVFISCSSGEMGFQKNSPDPDYYLFGLLEDYPALEDAFHDVDQHTFNTLMADGVNVDLDCTVDILPITPDVIDPLTALLGDARSILGRVIYQDQGDHPDDPYNYYAKDFYAFSDDLAAFTAGSAEDITEILRKSMGYIEYAHVDDVEDVMSDLSTLLRNPDMASLMDVLQEAGGKLLLQANSSMEYEGNSIDLGNATRGVDSLLSGLRDISYNDAAARQRLFDIIREMNDLFSAKVGPENKHFNEVLRELLINIEDYATVGGQVYSNNTDYYQDNGSIYVNTELRNGLKEMWPSLVSLFIKAKGSWEPEEMPDWSVLHDPENGESPLEYLTRKLYDLKINCDIDFEDYKLENSLSRMVEYNAYGEERNSASYKVSYLDHMVYTLIASYDFGYLTRKGGDDNEPYDNAQDGRCEARRHGLPSGGIITINDSLYTMASHAKEARSNTQNCTIGWLGAYNLALDCRANSQTWNGDTGGLLSSVDITNGAQGSYIYRHKNPFNSNNAGNYKYYQGYDFPTLALFSGFSAGDAGIPNGGQTGIIPTSNNTTVGTNNDFRTYYPYTGNGLGELNTGRFTMGWIARACWEGEGPYYYADPDAPMVSFDVDLDGVADSCYVYYRPDGRIFALVSKPSLSDSSTWKYMYPYDGGNDAIDPDDPYGESSAYRQRENRYRASWDTDHYLIKSDYINYYDDENNAPGGWTGYYSPASVCGTTGMNKYKMHSLQGTTGRNQNGDDIDASTTQAGALRFWEKISEGDPVRECASQEEALYRNFQWLMLEKKFVFVMPMRSFVHIKATAAWCINVHLNIDSPVFTIIEANGMAGIANARKTGSVGTWVKKGDEGIALGHAQPNGANYGDSHEPADGRLWAIVKEDSSYKNIPIVGTDGDYVDINTIWNTILGTGKVLPEAIGDNLAPIARMGFLQPELVESNSPEIGNPSSDTWYNRIKLLPVVVALAGDLHQKSYYKAPDDPNDHWYNFAEMDKHKYPLKNVRDLIAMLASPQFKYYKTPYSGAPEGWWVPEVNNRAGEGNYAFLTPSIINGGVDYGPRSDLRSVVQVLTESEGSDTALADGLIPALAKTEMVSKLMSFLQTTGDSTGIYSDVNKTSSDYTQWGARRKVFYGLEQVFTSIKSSRGVATERNYFNLLYPDGMFTTREVDVNLDSLLDELIGSDPLGKGLAVFVDHREESHPDYIEGYNWDNYYKLTEGIGELLSKKGSTSGEYCITDNLVNVLESTLSSFNATDAQLKGVRHTLGSVFTEYDDAQGKWVYPQDLKNILTVHLPDILDAYQGHHQNLIFFANSMLMKDGFIEYLLANLDSRYPAEDVYTQLHAFLGNELVCLPDSALWCDLNELLISFVDMIIQQNGLTAASASLFEETVYMPEVAPTAKYDSYNIDPYTALGEILSK